MSTDTEPIEIECPSCNGDGCNECKETGQVRIKGCPQKECQSIVETIELADMFHNGLPPIQGGVVDQSAWFVSAAQRVKSEDAKAKAE